MQPYGSPNIGEQPCRINSVTAVIDAFSEPLEGVAGVKRDHLEQFVLL
jgi:hypothetical protein